MMVNGSMNNGTSLNGTSAMELNLRIYDSDLHEELAGYEEGEERENFAISALKIGAIALRQAQGRIDADMVRQEGIGLSRKWDSLLRSTRAKLPARSRIA